MRDVNGDGAKDLIALETNATRIYIQNAGTFGPQTWTLAGTPGYALDAGDLNGDGTVDLAILTADTLQVWFQTPSGTWPGFPSLNITALGYDDLAIADLSGDGLPDVLLVRPHELRVFAQTPGNLNTTGLGRTLDTGNGTLALTAADVNGDQRPDLVLTEVNGTTGDGWLYVYSQGGAEFILSAKIAGQFTGPFAVGDLNDDGVPDIAAAAHDRVTVTDTVAVFLQRFTGGFGASPSFELSVDGFGPPSAVGIGRLSGRPFNDIVARTRGRLVLYEQDDLAPVLIQVIPSDVSFNAGSSGAGLIDLRNYFADDHGILRFQVFYEESPAVLHASLNPDGHHLDFTPSSTWYGRARFQVNATDGIPGHSAVLSNMFYVMVNALPGFTSAPPAQVRVGEKFLYQATVSDPFPADDTHTFSLLEAPAGMTIDPMTGLVEWIPKESDAGAHSVRLRASDAHGGAGEQAFSLQVVVGPAPPPTTAIVAVTTLGALLILGASAIASENVKWGLLMVFIPLYSKIKREQVLDHFVRGQIYGYVLANPGEHYNAIKVALNLTNGSLAHHLKTLERERFIKSKRFGLYRRFYPMNMKIPEDGFFTPNEIQKTIVELIRTTPAITQKEIAERLGLTPPTVNYHVGILSEHGAIRVERAGRKTHCFVIEPGAPAPTSAPSGGPGTPGPSAPRPPQ